ncbi:MAG: fumarylacetoacetate hydrolase family protein, partial [Cyanobacteria bacterium REEB65]|nr:fumarylacetoacetate hydrolase family protein [Cyanobacteria bacterium REEB65]
MKLATIAGPDPATPAGGRDGRLVLVSPDGSTGTSVPEFATLLSAIQNWQQAEPILRAHDARLRSGNHHGAFALTNQRLMAPLPRTWAWLDGSAFLHHVVLVRKARGAQPPEDLYSIPLMYQGVSDSFLGPTDDIPLIDPAHGMDFEAEIAVVLDDVPMGTMADRAGQHIKLLLLMNDVSLRNLIPREL